VYDCTSNGMLIFGGYGETFTLSSNIYFYSLSSNIWTAINTAGSSPTARFGHSAVFTTDFDSTLLSAGGLDASIFTGAMIVHGGSQDAAGNQILSDTWALLFPYGKWMSLNISSTSRKYHSAVYAKHSRQMLIFGGQDANTVKRDLISLNVTNMLMFETLSNSGPAMFLHTAFFSADLNQMFAFGNSAYGLQVQMYRFVVGSQLWIGPISQSGSVVVYIFLITITWCTSITPKFLLLCICF
jgi:hypothetical protein